MNFITTKIIKNQNRFSESFLSLKCFFTLLFCSMFLLTACNDKKSILLVTDIHFNPFADTLIVDQLVQASSAEWDSVFSQNKDKKITGYHEETSPELFELLLKSMEKQKPGVSAVLFTGDVLCHNFNELCYKYIRNVKEEGKNEFIYKTMEYVSMKMRENFPSVSIYFSLGNNDSFKGDYAIVNDGDFLHKTTSLFYDNLINPATQTANNSKAKKDFYDTYSAHGYYVQDFPLVSNGRLIGLNTIFFSNNFPDSLYSIKPGKEELIWLEKQLTESEKAGEKVFLLLHIPPGINVYTSQHKSNGSDMNVSLFWQEEYNDRYLELMQRYHKTIAASFAGHTHMDDFRLIYNQETNDKKPLDYVHITPSVSPVFGNNPAFQIIDLNVNTGELTETNTYYLNISKPFKDFEFEYEYRNVYDENPDAEGLNIVYRSMIKNEKKRDTYTKYYNGQSPKSKINFEWKWYWSGIGNLTKNDFTKAYNKLQESSNTKKKISLVN